jgi:ribose transport system permease protein
MTAPSPEKQSSVDTTADGGLIYNPDEEDERSRFRKTVSFLSQGDGSMWTLAVLIIICIGFGIGAPDFWSKANWVATSEYAVEYLLLALGETFVIVTAGIDLSVGANLGFSAMFASVIMSGLLNGHMSPILVTIIGFIIALAAGTLVGVVNGVLITRLKITPFIVTLGTMGMCTGATYLLDNGNQVSNLPHQITTIGTTIWLGGWLPAIVLVAAVFTVLSWLLLSRTRFGLRTFVVGSNYLAAQRAGVNVDRHLIRVYAFAGFMAGLAGLMVTSKFTIATPIAGANDELDAIAAVVIGGASLFGGTGSIIGTLIGTFIVSILVTGLVLLNVQPYWQEVAVGAVLIVAVVLDQVRRRLADELPSRPRLLRVDASAPPSDGGTEALALGG